MVKIYNYIQSNPTPAEWLHEKIQMFNLENKLNQKDKLIEYTNSILNEILTSPTSSQFLDYNTPTALGIAPYLTQKYAFKTGTTDTDHWAVGFNKDKLMIIWEGYDNNDIVRVGISKEIKKICCLKVYPSIFRKDIEPLFTIFEIKLSVSCFTQPMRSNTKPTPITIITVNRPLRECQIISIIYPL